MTVSVAQNLVTESMQRLTLQETGCSPEAAGVGADNVTESNDSDDNCSLIRETEEQLNQLLKENAATLQKLTHYVKVHRSVPQSGYIIFHL